MTEIMYDAQRQPRPILARDADSAYWMSRYIERAENVARLLLVTAETLVDMRDLDPELLERQWQSVARIMHVPNAPAAGQIAFHMTFGADNPSSLLTCITRARENARGIREGISSDMWEHLNGIYWNIIADETRMRFAEAPAQLFQQIVTGAMTFHGLTDQTLPHDQRWNFAQLGKYFERVAFTCRTLQSVPAAHGVSAEVLSEALSLRNMQGMSTLRCCNSLEAYRRMHPGELNATTIAGFLLLDPTFPRSIRHCVAAARQAASAIRKEVRPRVLDPAERILGRLQAELDYADGSEILAQGLEIYLGNIQLEISQAAMAVQKSYFLH